MDDPPAEMTDSLSDSALSLTEAASALGISERTVLRRIKDGTVHARVQDQERQIALLQAPKDEPPAAEAGQRRSWWKRLLGV